MAIPEREVGVAGMTSGGHRVIAFAEFRYGLLVVDPAIPRLSRPAVVALPVGVEGFLLAPGVSLEDQLLEFLPVEVGYQGQPPFVPQPSGLVFFLDDGCDLSLQPFIPGGVFRVPGPVFRQGLKVSVGELANRLECCKTTRPVLEGRTGEALRTFIAESLSRREPFYEKASVVFDAETMMTEQDVRQITDTLIEILA